MGWKEWSIYGNGSEMSAACSIDLVNETDVTPAFSIHYEAYHSWTPEKPYEETLYEMSICLSVFLLPVITFSSNASDNTITLVKGGSPVGVEFTASFHPGYLERYFQTVLLVNGTRATTPTVYIRGGTSYLTWYIGFTYSWEPKKTMRPGVTTYSFFLNDTRASTGVTKSVHGLGVIESRLLHIQSPSIDFAVVIPPSEPQPTPLNNVTVGLSIQPKSDVTLYPMKSNDTVLTIGYAGMELTQPIRVELAETPPNYLKVTLNATDLTPKPGGLSSVALKIFFNTTNAIYPTLPAEIELTIRAKAAGAEKTTAVTVKLHELQWLILYYSESDCSGAYIQPGFTQHIVEMVSSIKADVPEVAVLGLVSLNTTWHLPTPGNVQELPGHSASFLIFEEGKITEHKRLGPIDMGHTSSLESLLNLGETMFPARYRNLIIEDHGYGIRGIVSSRYGTLSIKGLSTVLSRHKVNVLTLAACLMSQMEVFYELRERADYIVASELLSYAEAFSFKSFISELYQNPGVEPYLLAKSIVETSGTKGVYMNQTLVALDNSKLEPLRDAINGLAASLQRSYDSKDNETQLEILKCGGNSAWVQSVAPYIDLRGFADNLAKDDLISKYDIKEAATGVVAALDNAILSKKLMYYDWERKEFVNVNYYGGVSILFYDIGFEWSRVSAFVIFKGVYRTLRFSDDPSWLGFLESYAARQKYEENRGKTPSSTVTLSHGGHELYLSINDPSGRHVGFNQSEPSLTKIDLGIVGTNYFDMGNGTVVIYLPGTVTDYNITVDGTQMQEAKEDYTLDLSGFIGDAVSAEKVVTNTIGVGTRQTTQVTITEKEITVGATQIENVKPNTQPTGGGGSGIPSFPYESIILGIIIGAVLFWALQRRQLTKTPSSF
jgi:hypothetical protein